MKNFLRNPWSFPFILIIFMVAILSLRKLSDPDIGSHLKAGKWVVENQSIPSKDTFTYTVRDHDYTDMNWLFQVTIYSFYRFAGYRGLSILVMISLLFLLFLLMVRNQKNKVPLFIAGFVCLAGFLVIESRITLRPEIVTFIFITMYLMILEHYYRNGGKIIMLLPLLMIPWCNIHGLFVLGLGLTGIYFISLLIRDRRIDMRFLLWMIITILACLVNPYFIKGFTFPLELFTRFDAGNIFHAHIKELKSFYSLDRLLFKDILFLVFVGITFLFSILTWKRRKFHDFVLLVVFAYLAFVSIRNIALFAVIGMPVLAVSLNDIYRNIRDNEKLSWLRKRMKYFRATGFIFMLFIPLAVTVRLLTDAYYADNNEYTKTGAGIDSRQLPEKAAEFMIRNGMSGRIINGISLGGWLSWKLPQPVFIDGRLEVIKEAIYQELTESWNNGLEQMADKYKGDLVIYNYTKYWPWTAQLSGIEGWRLIYIDGLSVIFARKTESIKPGEPDKDSLFRSYQVPLNIEETEKERILAINPETKAKKYFDGFFHKVDYTEDDLLNIGSFFLQLKKYDIAENFLLENLKRTHGKNRFIYYALADIYAANHENAKATICYRQILHFDPGNITAKQGIERSGNTPGSDVTEPAGIQISNEAKQDFNHANDLYRNGNIREALRLYDEAIRLAPQYYKAYNNRGILKATAQKDYNAAIQDFSKAIEIFPDYSDAWLGRGIARLELKDIEGACLDWQRASALRNKQAALLLERYSKEKGKRVY